MSDAERIQAPDWDRILEQRRRLRIAKRDQLGALHKLKSGPRQDKARVEALVQQGRLKSASYKKAYATGIRKITGDDPFKSKFAQGRPATTNIFSRPDFNYIPLRDILEHFGQAVPTCNCGEAALYVQPPWTGGSGASLDYWLWGDGQDHVYNWNDAPPDFQWIVAPQGGQATTASAEMQMSVDGGDDGWNQSWATIWAIASWLPTSPGRFTGHVHFGGADSLVAAVAGDDCEIPPWDDDAYFGAWISLWVAYADAGNWITLGDTGWVTIADRYECVGWNALGQAGWYWNLDHWLALGEYSIPVNRRVYLTMSIELETSAGSDDECYSGVSAGPNNRLLITPVITGTQCARI